MLRLTVVSFGARKLVSRSNQRMPRLATLLPTPLPTPLPTVKAWHKCGLSMEAQGMTLEAMALYDIMMQDICIHVRCIYYTVNEII